jgi:hypothetical protein
MIVYAEIVQLLKDWPLGCPVKPKWKRIEAALERGQCFAKSITISEESRPDRLVFYIEGRRISGAVGWYHTQDREIIAVWSYNHGVQVWAVGEENQTCQAVEHMRNALALEVK